MAPRKAAQVRGGIACTTGKIALRMTWNTKHMQRRVLVPTCTGVGADEHFTKPSAGTVRMADAGSKISGFGLKTLWWHQSKITQFRNAAGLELQNEGLTRIIDEFTLNVTAAVDVQTRCCSFQLLFGWIWIEG